MMKLFSRQHDSTGSLQFPRLVCVRPETGEQIMKLSSRIRAAPPISGPVPPRQRSSSSSGGRGSSVIGLSASGPIRLVLRAFRKVYYKITRDFLSRVPEKQGLATAAAALSARKYRVACSHFLQTRQARSLESRSCFSLATHDEGLAVVEPTGVERLNLGLGLNSNSPLGGGGGGDDYEGDLPAEAEGFSCQRRMEMSHNNRSA